MKRVIVYLHTSAIGAAHLKATGAFRSAGKRNWSIVRIDFRSIAQTHTELRYWKPDACIVDAAHAPARLIFDPAFSRIPTVFIDCVPRDIPPYASYIFQNPDAVAKIAADELLKHHLASYAYVAWPDRTPWSETRGDAFVRHLEKRGIHADVFRAPDSDRKHLVDALGKWLKDHARPIGIFTATDSLSEQVLQALGKIGFDVPTDALIIGVDNEISYCENARPTLSSVDVGFEATGSRAVEILDELIRNPRHRPFQETYPETHLVTRSSSRLTTKADKAVIAALDLIRRHAAEGLAAADVLKCFACSRRLAELRFRSLAGRSILDEIHARQIELAKELISNPYQKLSLVPQSCGNHSLPHFQRIFRKSVGMTMSEFRAWCEASR